MKPKKLNLQEIIRVYFIFKSIIDSLSEDDVVGNIVDRFINETSSEALLECIHIMYDNSIEFDTIDEFALLFVQSLVENEFFHFIQFIKGISDGSTNRQ